MFSGLIFKIPSDNDKKKKQLKKKEQAILGLHAR